MTEEHLLVEKDGHVLTLRMNRPEAKNAFSPNMLGRMAEAWERADSDDEIRCVILTGSDTVFCAGADLKAMMSNPPPGDEYAQRFTRDADLAWRALLRHYRLTKPLIAAVEGPAIAGGTEILQATDIRVAGESATFGVAEVRRGLFPLGGSTVRLRRQIPYTIAAELLLTGKTITAAEAKGHRPDRLRRTRWHGVCAGARDRRHHQRERPDRGAVGAAVAARDRGAARGRGAEGRARDRHAGLRHRGRAGGTARVRREAPGQLRRPVRARPGDPIRSWFPEDAEPTDNQLRKHRAGRRTCARSSATSSGSTPGAVGRGLARGREAALGSAQARRGAAQGALAVRERAGLQPVRAQPVLRSGQRARDAAAGAVRRRGAAGAHDVRRRLRGPARDRARRARDGGVRRPARRRAGRIRVRPASPARSACGWSPARRCTSGSTTRPASSRCQAAR